MSNSTFLPFKLPLCPAKSGVGGVNHPPPIPPLSFAPDCVIHKLILSLSSPVFKAMLESHCKEESENKITLEEKDLKSMVLFLQVLYPPSMFEKSRPPLDDESRLPVMALAEEYTCVNLIKQYIDEAEITPENVLKILPYAAKYHPTALPRMYNVINWSAPTSKLEKVVPIRWKANRLQSRCF